MSENHSGGNKTEAPTPKRLFEARKRGDVARSRDLVSAAMLIGVFIITIWIGPTRVTALGDYVSRALLASTLSDGFKVNAVATAHHALQEAILFAAWLALPFLGVAVLMAFLANFVQVGSLFALDPWTLKWSRLNPARNFRQMLEARLWLDLARGAFVIAALATIGTLIVVGYLPTIATLGGSSLAATLHVSGKAFTDLVLYLTAAVLFLGGLDYVIQRRRYQHRLRMTREEVQREHREVEGDPQRKAERMRVQRELASDQMLSQVQFSDCVIINPTHVAVAIRYDEQETPAPRVVAKGERLVAQKIRELAKQHGIPIVRNVPLAQALNDLALDQEIPEDLYDAVAQVLRFVYELH